MAKNDNLTDFLTDVAEAIREKKGTTEKINPLDFSSEIASIESSDSKDWSEIGCSAEPSFIQEGFDYAKEIMENIDTTELIYSSKFKYDQNLVILPSLTLPNATNLQQMCFQAYRLMHVELLEAPLAVNCSSMFYYCQSLRNIKCYLPAATSLSNAFGSTSLTSFKADWSNHVTSFERCFELCSELLELDIDTSSAKSLSYLVSECPSLLKISELNCPNATTLSGVFRNCSQLTKIPGLDMRSVTTMSAPLYGCTRLQFALFKNIGTSTLTTYSFKEAIKWGMDSEEIPNARQSLIDSLITYSYDRAANGLDPATILLSSSTKALLTDEEIAQITAKGFTIS